MILAACFVASGWLLVSAVRDMRDADAAVCMVLLVAVAVMMEIAWVVTGRRAARYLRERAQDAGADDGAGRAELLPEWRELLAYLRLAKQGPVSPSAVLMGPNVQLSGGHRPSA